jgi:hypothetical protein
VTAAAPEHVDIVCSLDASSMAERMAEFERLFASALVSQRREPGQLRLEFALTGKEEAAVRELFAREAECCTFFSFGIQRDAERLIVTMAVP